MEIKQDDSFVRHSFILAFYFLLRAGDNCSFEAALRATIQQGGDTDTNASIVSGMIGAAVGLDGIPAEMREKVLKFDCSADDLYSQKLQRPDFLSVGKHFEKSVQSLLAKRPTGMIVNIAS